MDLKQQYPYKYETHMHTSEGSACGKNTAREMVRAYKAAGYAGIIVTDHAWGGNTAVDPALPWEAWVDAFCAGYENARDEGEKIGLDVFFGWEAGFDGTEFLIYGLDKAWMKAHPELRKVTVEEQFKLVKASGGMVVQAHPYRERSYIPEIRLFPHDVDAVEGINAGHSGTDVIFNHRAIEYANCYHLPMTAGSDMHTVDLRGAGVAFATPLADIHDYARRILENQDFCLTDGKVYYKFN